MDFEAGSNVTTTEESTPGQHPAAQARVAIVSPTRNEAQNIEEFVKRVFKALSAADVAWEIVFADDSDDETLDIIAEVGVAGAPVRAVHRLPEDRRDSLSGAISGAIATVDADIVVVMDADLQHPPELLPDLIEPLLDDTADFVIGTRYAPGGTAEGLGSTWRRFASKSAATVTKAVFPHYWRCSDMASGLLAFKLADFDQSPRPSTGFKFLPEALVKTDPKVLHEVPYSFEERMDGLSKARVRDGFRLTRTLLALRLTTRSWRPVAVTRQHQSSVSSPAVVAAAPAASDGSPAAG